MAKKKSQTLTKQEKSDAVAHIMTLTLLRAYRAGDVVYIAYPGVDENVPAVTLDDHMTGGSWIPQALICRVLDSSGNYDHKTSVAKAENIGAAIKGIEIAGEDSSPILYAGPGTTLVHGAHLVLLMDDREIPGIDVMGDGGGQISGEQAREREGTTVAAGKPGKPGKAPGVDTAADLAPVKAAKPVAKPAAKPAASTPTMRPSKPKKTAKKKAGMKAPGTIPKKPGAAPLRVRK